MEPLKDEDFFGPQLTDEEFTGMPQPEALVDTRSPAARNFGQLAGGGTRGQTASIAADIQQRRQARANQERRRQEIIGGAVGNYDPEQRFSNFWLQADTARSRTFEDVQTKFRNEYPEGEIIAVPISGSVVDDTGRGRTVVVARSNSDEPFREYNAIGPQVLEALGSEESLGAIAGVTLLGSRLPGPIGPSVAVVGGLAAGSLAKYGIERARGFEQDTGLPEAFSRASGLGVAGGILDIVFRGGLSLGRAFVWRPEGAELSRRASLSEVQDFAREVDLTPIARGQASEHPILRMMFKQTGTSQIFDELTEAQRRSLITSFTSWRDTMGTATGMSRSTLERATMAQAYELEGPLARQLVRATEGTDILAAGQAIQEGVRTFEAMSRQLTNTLYDDALRLGQGVSFNTSPARNMAAVIETGTPIRTGSTVGRAEGPLHAEIQAVVNDIRALPEVLSPDILAGRGVTAYEQLKALRTRLYDLTHHAEGSVRGPAKRLYGALTESIESPIGGSREFLMAWRNASSVHSRLEGILEINSVRMAMTTHTPERLAAQLGTPGNASSLDIIKQTLMQNPETRGNWDIFRNAWISQITNSPQRGLARLDAFRNANDMAGLRLLVDEAEESALRQLLNGKIRHETGAIATTARRNLDEQEAGLHFINRASRQDVSDFVAGMGGRESVEAVALKRSLINDILNRASHLNEAGQTVMHSGKLIGIIDDIIKTGQFDSLLSPAELRALAGYQRYASVIAQSSDVGGSLQMASVAAGVKSPHKVGRFTSALQTMIANSFVAHILTHPAAFRTLTRFPVTANNATRIRALAQAAEIVNLSLEEEHPVPPDNQ